MTVPHELRAKFGLCSCEVRAFPQGLGKFPIDRALDDDEFLLCGRCGRIYGERARITSLWRSSSRERAALVVTSRGRLLVTDRALL